MKIERRRHLFSEQSPFSVGSHGGPAEPGEVRLITGALASSQVAAGTNALADLMGEALPAEARTAIVGALALSEPATPDSLRALAAGLDQADGAEAAYGLGSHGRKSLTSNPDGARAAVDELLARYARAGSDDERRLYLEALGNSGDRRALAVLADVAGGRDEVLASAAAFALRFIPGDDVDALLAQLLERPEVAFSAVRAVAYRDPARWRDALLAAQARYPEHNGVQSEIIAILQRWS
jgi:hypothetical protein